ncbi:MAG: hypothetical protein ACRCX8_10270 [Sarcina sp.]
MKAINRITNNNSNKEADFSVAAVNERIANRFVGNDVNFVDLLKKSNKEIDLTAAYSSIGFLARAGYSAGSKIGLIISLTCVCEALKDKDLNKQFLVTGSTKHVDLFKLSLVFPYVGSESNGKEGYTSIFTEEEYVIVTDKFKRTQTILKACKEKIEEFPQALKNITCLELKDLIAIGKDLEIVATVMSELEIDAAKDDAKREGMIDVSDFMNEYMTQSSRSFKLLHNFEAMKEAKRVGNSELNISLDLATAKKSLFKFEEVCEDTYKMFKAHNEKFGTDMPSDEEIKDTALKSCCVEDPLFELIGELVDSLTPDLTALSKQFNKSNMDMFRKFDITPEIDQDLNTTKETPAQSKLYVQRVIIKLYDIISSIYKFKKYLNMNKIEEVGITARNIIYTVGTERGMSVEDIFFLGVHAGWLKDGEKDVSARGAFRYKAVESVFATELKCHFAPEAMCSEVEIEVPDELLEVEDLFEDGEIFEFVNGACNTMGNDGEEYSMIRLDNTSYTGDVLVEIDEEGFITFCEPLDPYEFEATDFFLLDSISDMRMKEFNKLTGEQMNELLDQESKNIYAFNQVYNKAKIVDTVPNFSEETVSIKYANQVKGAFTEFNNKIKFVVEHKDNFELKPSRRRSHLYMKQISTGDCRMAGELKALRVTKSLKTCSNMEIVSTPVGAILVTK